MPGMVRHFGDLFARSQTDQKYLCVGLDPDFDTIPTHLHALGLKDGLLAFNRGIVDATRDIAGSYKPNTAFYEAHGSDGWDVLRETISYIHETVPDALVIADAKRADIGSTNNGYAQALFEYLRADAVTVHPYLGSEALKPFLDRTDKGIFVLCRTSNSGSGEIQELMIDDEPLYRHIARMVSESWNGGGNFGLVTGATYPTEIAEVRAIAPAIPLLIPGIGAQGGDIEATVRAAQTNMIVSSSRSIMYASQGEDFVEAAQRSAQDLHGSLIKAAVL